MGVVWATSEPSAEVPQALPRHLIMIQPSCSAKAKAFGFRVTENGWVAGQGTGGVLTPCISISLGTATLWVGGEVLQGVVSGFGDMSKRRV